MLERLSIRDVVLIAKLDLAFGTGLSVLTGETGAGKSILLDALGLALGARADAGLVRAGQAQAVVTAAFDVPDTHAARKLLEEQGLESDGPIVLRRVVTAEGRSKAFANDQPVGVALLRQLGDSLVEIQGQHEERGLLDPAGHRAMLDAFGGLEPKVKAVREAHAARSHAASQLAEAEAQLAQARREEDYLRHVDGELRELAPKAGEESELAAERTRLQAAEKLSGVFDEVDGYLSGDQGATHQLAAALRRLQRTPGLEQIAAPVIAALERAAIELQDGAQGLSDVMRAAGNDPQRLERIEERLFALRAAARKHGVPPDGLEKVAADIAAKLSAIEGGSVELKGLAQAAKAAEEAYLKAARDLSAARAKAAEKLDKAVAKELPPLKLERARFRTHLSQEGDGGPDGLDRVAFEIATNAGAAFGPLVKIASGGELSRFILALKVSLAARGTAPTLVFDEVDRGIGGATAAAVGNRLAALAQAAQVLVVTHSPQVAAKGAAHFRISKAQGSSSAATQVMPLEDNAARQEEIARMIAGETVTDAARDAARALMEGH